MPLLNKYFLYSSAGIVAFSCVAYELLLGSYATFLMGASIFQYSLVISLMMFSMGLGAFLTRYFKGDFYLAFFWVETLLAWLALMAVPTMYFAFCLNFAPTPILIVFVTLLGLGIGMEIPLISEILQSHDSLPNVLFSDYLGGFFGGLAFPLLLLPNFGFFPTGALLALLNSLVAISFYFLFKQNFRKNKVWIQSILTITILFCFVELYYAEGLRVALESYYFGIHRS